jgi:DNA-binding Xre family transcriptional regulator
MSTTADLVTALKKELKAAQMTYADLAQGLGMAESSVKRMLAKGDMALSRIDAICRVLKLDFAELARRVADAQPLLQELTQEHAGRPEAAGAGARGLHAGAGDAQLGVRGVRAAAPLRPQPNTVSTPV